MSTTDVPPEPPTGPPISSPRRRRRRYLWWSVGAVVVLWVLIGGLELLNGVKAADRGISEIDRVRAHLTAIEVTGTSNVTSLHRAHTQFAAARSDLESPFLAPADRSTNGARVDAQAHPATRCWQPTPERLKTARTE